MPKNGWIGVDFDRTLAKYDSWQGTKLGEPIVPMLDRVIAWLADGKEVRIFTARVSLDNPEQHKHRMAIEQWCERYIGTKLKVTAEKDFTCAQIYDDIAVSVEPNTGRILTYPA